MYVQSQDAYYWQVIHHLVVHVGITAFKVKSNEKEIWLEKEDTDKTTLIRIYRRDMDWGNYISRDLENVAKDGESIRKELRCRHLNIINVYISTFLPVDTYESLLEPVVTKNKRIKIDTFLLHGETGGEMEVSKLSEKLGCKLPLRDAGRYYTTDDIQHYRRRVVTISEKKLNEEKALFTYGKPVFTMVLLVNVLVIFGLMEYYGSSTSLLTLVEFGAKYDPLIYQGEWWRFFTAIFLHIGFLHLFMNSLALFYLGSAVERIYGTSRFIIIYLTAGLFGSISSFAFNSQISAGASGAIFGCFGALLYFGVVHRKLFFRTIGKNVIVILIINLGLGAMIPMIDNSAHVGGLIGGFLASAALHLPKHKFKYQQILTFGATLTLVSGLLIYGFSSGEDPEKMHLINVQISQELLQRGDIERAYPLLKAAVDEDVDIVEANFLLAYSEARLGLLQDAEKNLLITLEHRPFLHEAHFNLSLVYFELKQYLDAYRSVEKALELKPNTEDYQNLKNTLEKILEKTR
ncbi:rhomboid family intramembrane serine protease [Anaerobacillus alkaliphilus]|uniref:Rhomboid family intramembrane serine protease n=1 Tax=Anaerobacillus alkaliphilus TaxID=1548597 RepID=A0A4Q0VRQ0_9BACI|nr:rhomboid family intramembrane serine protease [Anaerobacillus alkaliphilus]RXI99455.1 rhomboid family intramembrane serine protease [Anaerobacillus alkaliphilus]